MFFFLLIDDTTQIPPVNNKTTWNSRPFKVRCHQLELLTWIANELYDGDYLDEHLAKYTTTWTLSN